LNRLQVEPSPASWWQQIIGLASVPQSAISYFGGSWGFVWNELPAVGTAGLGAVVCPILTPRGLSLSIICLVLIRLRAGKACLWGAVWAAILVVVCGAMRLASEEDSPAMTSVEPATKVATAMVASSFDLIVVNFIFHLV
jgi:hypothetical protein